MLTPQAGRHLEPEMIAALVDGRLSLQERNRAIAHLGECKNCRAILAGVAKTATELIGG